MESWYVSWVSSWLVMKGMEGRVGTVRLREISSVFVRESQCGFEQRMGIGKNEEL